MVSEKDAALISWPDYHREESQLLRDAGGKFRKFLGLTFQVRMRISCFDFRSEPTTVEGLQKYKLNCLMSAKRSLG